MSDKENQFDYFDDCAICQGMKKAQKEGRELTESELLELFAVAKAEGAQVGGEYFDR